MKYPDGFASETLLINYKQKPASHETVFWLRGLDLNQ